MRKRHTRHTDPELFGGTIQRSLRLPADLVEDVILEIAGGIPDIHTLTDAMTDALWLWRYEAQREKGIMPAIQAANTAPKLSMEDKIDHVEYSDAASNGHDPDFDSDERVVEAIYPASPVNRPSFGTVDLPPSDA